MDLLPEQFTNTADALANSSVHALLLSGVHGFIPDREAEYLAHSFTTQHTGIAQVLRPEDGKTGISIEQVRRLYQATRSKRLNSVMVWTIWLDGASPAAQNALLKLLEEPPAQTVFILLVATPESALMTIRSRTQTVAAAPYRVANAEQWLALHAAQLDLPVRKQLLFLAEGSASELYRLTTDAKYQLAQLANANTAKTLLSGSVYDRLRCITTAISDREQALRIVHITVAMLTMLIERRPNQGLNQQLATYIECYEHLKENGSVRPQLLAAITTRAH